ncbi:hypothetical protein EZS27_034457, partial [termite gut metagenome]
MKVNVGYNTMLCIIGILIFIHQHIAELLLIAVQYFG